MQLSVESRLPFVEKVVLLLAAQFVFLPGRTGWAHRCSLQVCAPTPGPQPTPMWSVTLPGESPPRKVKNSRGAFQSSVGTQVTLLWSLPFDFKSPCTFKPWRQDSSPRGTGAKISGNFCLGEFSDTCGLMLFGNSK